MICNEQLKEILKSERRWTPKAFEHFKVVLKDLLVLIPLWPSLSRSYDMSKPEKKERPRNPSGSKATLFGDVSSDEVILVEGEWDLFAAFENGILNVVTGTNGAETFTDSMAKMLSGKSVSIVYDNDKAGRIGARKAQKFLKLQGCKTRIVHLPSEVKEAGDIRDYLTSLGKTAENLLELIEQTPWELPEEPEPVVHKLSEVTEEEVEWLWPHRIPKGAVTLLAGQAGIGKSFLVADIAAKVTNGSFFIEDLSPFGQGPVLIFNKEDSLKSTIKTRVAEAGANQEILYVVNDKVVFGQDLDFIRQTISRYKPVLVVFDPIVSFLGSEMNMNAGNEVRHQMEIPMNLARDFKTAVVCVVHINKNEQSQDLLNRIVGSSDFIGSVRSVLMVIKNPRDPNEKLFGHLKANISELGKTLKYRIPDGKKVNYTGVEPKPLQQFYDEFLINIRSKLAKEEAAAFAKEALEDGPMKISNLLEEAKQHGIAASTLKRALRDIATRKKISIKGAKGRGAGYWIYCLKEMESRFKSIDHLGLLEHWGEEEEKTLKIVQENQEDQTIDPGKYALDSILPLLDLSEG